MSLLFAGVFLILLELSEFQRTTKEDLTALARVIGNRSSAALMFDDRNLAAENLTVFNNMPAVQSTCLYDKNDAVFVGLANNTQKTLTCPSAINLEQNRFENKQLIVVNTILLDGDKIGTVYVRADLTRQYWRKIQFIGLLFLVLAVVLLMTFLLSQPLLKLITVPINKLVSTVKKIKDTGDYSIRAKKMGADEMGVLVESFNSLIETVEYQSQALVQAKNRYLTLYDDNPTMVFNISGAGVILSANLTGARQLGLTVEELQNCSLFNFVHSDDIHQMKNLIETLLCQSPASAQPGAS